MNALAPRSAGTTPGPAISAARRPGQLWLPALTGWAAGVADPLCGRGGRASSPVVFHVIAEQATPGWASGPSRGPRWPLTASFGGVDRRLAGTAKKLVPLTHPGDSPPNPATPSKALADLCAAAT